MATINSWNSNNPGVPININTTGTQTTSIGTSGNTGTISIGNTSSGAVAIDCGTVGITVGTTANAHSSTFGSTNSTSATTVQSGSGALNVTSTNGALTINSGTGTLGISTDASATTVSIATGGAVKGVTLGSTNSTSATTVQSGSGALNITSTNGAITMNSGTGTVGIGTDATAATYNFATGAGAKVVTLGTTNGASSLALKYGTADFSLASATGTIINALDTGEITYPLQPSFTASLSANTAANVTGDGTNYTVICNTVRFDQNSDYNNGTGTFTAPVTGKYLLIWNVGVFNMAAAHTVCIPQISTSNIDYDTFQMVYISSNVLNQMSFPGSVIADMDAADVANFKIYVSGSTKTVGVVGSAAFGTDRPTFVSGQLLA